MTRDILTICILLALFVALGVALWWCAEFHDLNKDLREGNDELMKQLRLAHSDLSIQRDVNQTLLFERRTLLRENDELRRVNLTGVEHDLTVLNSEAIQGPANSSMIRCTFHSFGELDGGPRWPGP